MTSFASKVFVLSSCCHLVLFFIYIIKITIKVIVLLMMIERQRSRSSSERVMLNFIPGRNVMDNHIVNSIAIILESAPVAICD